MEVSLCRKGVEPLQRTIVHPWSPSTEELNPLWGWVEGCNTPAHPRTGPVTPGSSLGSLDWPHRSTLVFSAHFVLTRAHPGRTSRWVTHHQIAPGQARLTSEFFSDELPEKKLQLVDMSILSILLSPESGYHKGVDQILIQVWGTSS